MYQNIPKKSELLGDIHFNFSSERNILQRTIHQTSHPPQREVADEAGAEDASVALEGFFVEGDLGTTSAACSSE